jgi:hypothetical protein
MLRWSKEGPPSVLGGTHLVGGLEGGERVGEALVGGVLGHDPLEVLPGHAPLAFRFVGAGPFEQRPGADDRFPLLRLST